jgi:osmotically-inducible protein OsmY
MKKRLLLSLTVQLVAVTCLLGVLATRAAAQDNSQPAADNTKMNADKSAPTADQQKHDLADRDITRQIRQSVIRDKTLSTYAHNVKIISQNGMVTLRGPVRSDDEKRAIEADAVAVVGQDKVTDELQVKPKQ